MRKMTPERAAELLEVIRQMQAVSRGFYAQAVRVGNHAFIEFTGLMNEYINICEGSLAKGIDFTECTIHGSGQSLHIESFQRKYLAEKLTCIFETSFPDLMRGETSNG